MNASGIYPNRQGFLVLSFTRPATCSSSISSSQQLSPGEGVSTSSGVMNEEISVSSILISLLILGLSTGFILVIAVTALFLQAAIQGFQHGPYDR